MRVQEQVQEELLELGVVTQDHARRLAGSRREHDVLRDKGRPHGLDRGPDRRAQVERMLRPLTRPGERTEPIEKALHPVDLMGDGPTEVLDELLVAPAAWQELRKRLDRNQRVLDLVGDTRREHLEIGEPLGAPPLHLERLVRRQIAEDGDGTQHPACLIVKG